MKRITAHIATWIVALGTSASALAQATLPTTEGEIRRVDTRAQTVTLKHGAIPNLDMPPMTMVFRVQDPALLKRFKAGDAVRFTADKVDGNYTVLSLEPQGTGATTGGAAPAAHNHKH